MVWIQWCSGVNKGLGEFCTVSVEHWQVVKIEAPLPLDGHVEVAQVVTPGGKADETGDEEGVSLNEFPARITVDDDPSQSEPWKKSWSYGNIDYNLIILTE